MTVAKLAPVVPWAVAWSLEATATTQLTVEGKLCARNVDTNLAAVDGSAPRFRTPLHDMLV